jgi:esterase/lipase
MHAWRELTFGGLPCVTALMKPINLFAFLTLACVAFAPAARGEVSVFQVGKGKPLIVFLGGSEGGYPHIPFLVDEFVASDISVAEIGYFGLPETPKHLSEISIDAIAAKIEKLSENHSCVGILGLSKGAELALVLAAYKNVSDVTVALAPSSVVWQSSKASLSKASSWTLNGKQMPYVPYKSFSWAAVSAVLNVNGALALHEKSLTDTEAAKRAVIPVERVDQPVLLQGATRDQIWPSYEMANAVFERVNRLNPGHKFTLKTYDHDHYLLRNREAVDDLVNFLKRELLTCKTL